MEAASPRLDAVILAAGAGTRMRSPLPKVLHRLAGRPLIAHVLERAGRLTNRLHLVTGAGRTEVEAAVRADFGATDLHIRFHLQEPRLGTGHAVQQAIHACRPGGKTLVLYGDVPLVGTQLLRQLTSARTGLTLLTAQPADPTGYGRILRDERGVRAIIEERDGTAEQRAIREINTGVLCADTDLLRGWLGELQRTGEEYYLTGIVALAVRQGVKVRAVMAEDPVQVAGINTPEQLAAMETYLQQTREQTRGLRGG